MSDANDIHVLLKPDPAVAKRTLSAYAIGAVVGLPFVWLIFRSDDTSSPEIGVMMWVVLSLVLLVALGIHYWVLLRDDHGLMFASGTTVYERKSSFALWRRSQKLLDCGPGNTMKIEVAENYHRNERTYEALRPSRRVDIRLSNGSETAEIRPKRRDVEDDWKDELYRRFAEWQHSIGGAETVPAPANPSPASDDNPTASPPSSVSASSVSTSSASVPSAVSSSSVTATTRDANGDTIYPLLKSNPDHIKRHMFWAALRWIGGLFIAWLVLLLVLLVISQSDWMARFALYGVPILLLFGAFSVLRSYHRIAHDSMPMLYGTETAVYQRAGGMLRARYSKPFLAPAPGHPITITHLTRSGAEVLDYDQWRSWWNLKARIVLSNGTESAKWSSPLFLVEENWQTRFRRRFDAWQDATGAADETSPASGAETI